MSSVENYLHIRHKDYLNLQFQTFYYHFYAQDKHNCNVFYCQNLIVLKFKQKKTFKKYA